MRNLKLLEKYQPPPPRHQRKGKSQSTRKRKNITPLKSFNHPKIASTIMKKTETPHLKILNFSKNPNSIGKFFNSFELPGRSKMSTLPEKMSTPPKKMSTQPEKFPTPPEKISTWPPKKIANPSRKKLPPYPQNNNP